MNLERSFGDTGGVRENGVRTSIDVESVLMKEILKINNKNIAKIYKR